MGAGNSYSWRIPKSVTTGSAEVKKNRIRAFFDDEAYFEKGDRIRVKIVNREGLTQVMGMLQDFVPCHITPKTGSYWGGCCCLNILKTNTPKYMSQIGSIRNV